MIGQQTSPTYFFSSLSKHLLWMVRIPISIPIQRPSHLVGVVAQRCNSGPSAPLTTIRSALNKMLLGGLLTERCILSSMSTY